MVVCSLPRIFYFTESMDTYSVYFNLRKFFQVKFQMQLRYHKNLTFTAKKPTEVEVVPPAFHNRSRSFHLKSKRDGQFGCNWFSIKLYLKLYLRFTYYFRRPAYM